MIPPLSYAASCLLSLSSSSSCSWTLQRALPTGGLRFNISNSVSLRFNISNSVSLRYILISVSLRYILISVSLRFKVN